MDPPAMPTGTCPIYLAAARYPTWRELLAALALALAFVAATRLPLARPAPLELDEVGYLATIREYRLPMHHTLFLAAARGAGAVCGDSYRGFVLLDAALSVLALAATWWWLQSLVGPRTAAAATLVLGVAPVFWAYGAMAANYTAIPLVGSLLLGIAERGRSSPRPWHPYAAAAMLAVGAGYRQDIGTYWLPVFLVVLWQHRGVAALQALLVFGALCLSWFVPMLRDAGGWSAWRVASAEFARNAGYLNSYWHLGLIDGPVRYAVKGSMAVIWTFGPGLLFVPRGVVRAGMRRTGLILLSVIPALGVHLLVHFGVPGYALHYAPALVALIALGIGHRQADPAACDRSGAVRLVGLAALLASVFLLYPTDYDRPGFRGNFDLAFARQTRLGLTRPLPLRDPAAWRTINSQQLPLGVERAHARRQSLADVFR
jgi:hypothetical protein